MRAEAVLTPSTNVRDMVEPRDDYWDKKSMKGMVHEGSDSSSLWIFPGYYQQKAQRSDSWTWGGYGWWGGLGDADFPSTGFLGAIAGLFEDFGELSGTGEVRIPKNLVTFITIPTFICLTITAIIIFTCTHMDICCWGLCNDPPLREEYAEIIRKKEEKRRCDLKLAKRGVNQTDEISSPESKKCKPLSALDLTEDSLEAIPKSAVPAGKSKTQLPSKTPSVITKA